MGTRITWKILFAAVVLWMMWLPFSVSSGQGFAIPEEYKIKAGFLAQFARYITWPEKTGINDTSKPFVIAVIGGSPLGAFLKNTSSLVKIRGKKLWIKYFESPEQIRGCHILFISKAAENDLAKILAVTKNKPILTVGDTEGFAQRGVHINFYKKIKLNGKRGITFEINPSAILKASLSADKRLAELTRNVKTRKENR